MATPAKPTKNLLLFFTSGPFEWGRRTTSTAPPNIGPSQGPAKLPQPQKPALSGPVLHPYRTTPYTEVPSPPGGSLQASPAREAPRGPHSMAQARPRRVPGGVSRGLSGPSPPVREPSRQLHRDRSGGAGPAPVPAALPGSPRESPSSEPRAISESVPQEPPTATTASAARTTKAFRASPIPVARGKTIQGFAWESSRPGRKPTVVPPPSTQPRAAASIDAAEATTNDHGAGLGQSGPELPGPLEVRVVGVPGPDDGDPQWPFIRRSSLGRHKAPPETLAHVLTARTAPSPTVE